MNIEDNSQKCDVCGERPAVILVKIVTEKKIEEKGLCKSCAVRYLEHKDEIKEFSLIDEKLIDVIEEMKELLSGIVANISAISVIMNQQETSSKNGLSCGNCGMTYDNFKENGYLGCPYCYTVFKKYIEEFVFEVERSDKHIGKMPEKFAKIYILKKEIQFLNNKLKKLIYNEEYEEADKVKKKLENLIGNYKSGRDDEIN